MGSFAIFRIFSAGMKEKRSSNCISIRIDFREQGFWRGDEMGGGIVGENFMP